MTTLDYLLDVLKGKTKVIKLEDIHPYILPPTRYLSKARLAQIIYEDETLKVYFPKDVRRHADLQFCIDIINTLDPNFFPNCSFEIEEELQLRSKKKEDTIELSLEMHHMLMQMQGRPNQIKQVKGMFRVPKKARKKP